MIRVEGLTKQYRLGKDVFTALDDVSFHIPRGTLAAIIGQSGSGKTTLLNILGGLDTPTRGRYWLSGTDVSRFDELAWAAERNRTIGFVFQSFNLIPAMTALDNVALPLIYRRTPIRERRRRAEDALAAVGLAHRLFHRPHQLSGGQQQRVAIARALVGNPPVILADEPTGNLDSRTGSDILGLLKDLNRQGRTIVIVTHSADIAGQCRQILPIADGRLVDDAPREVPS